MCGIVGICQDPWAPVSGEILNRMNRLLIHRGPDDEGFWMEGNVGLAQRRLSIIDLETGNQPLTNEDGSLWIVFNGEIYNYLELRHDLIRRGHRLQTKSDTEVIVHLFEEKGPDCLQDLRGMFAIAIWNRKDRSLFLARDRVGEKPLFFTQLTNAFLFASEIKSFSAYPDFVREVDNSSLLEYLTFRYVLAPRTLFKDVYKLQPGHYLIYREHRSRETCYWDVFQEDQEPVAPPSDLQACKEELEELLRESIRLRLRSDVPLGAFLSGGVDSSAVVGIMSQLVTSPIKTFSVGFTNPPEYNELPYARAVASMFKTVHQEIVVQPQDIPEQLHNLIWYRDAPVSEPTDIALFNLSLLARQSVKVVLSGEGGDELFAGYAKYIIDPLASLYQMIPRYVEKLCIEWPVDHAPFIPRRLKSALHSIRIRDETERFASYFASLDLSDRAQILSREAFGLIDKSTREDIFAQHMAKLVNRSPMERMFYGDLRFWLPDNLLERGDRITMAASLEGRVPLLDHKLVEYASKIPPAWKIKCFQTKYVLKQTLKDLLPPSVLRRQKIGFSVPVREWFRTDLKGWLTEILRSEQFQKRNLFNLAEVETLLHRHLQGKQDFSKHLWMLVNLELWFRQLEAPPTVPPAITKSLPPGRTT
jgi:asparagine synthase (glutamine-hydrolysing)